MSGRFFCADPHFSHKGMVLFTHMVDGVEVAIRPEWGVPLGKGAIEAGLITEQEVLDRVAAMDEAMVERWNSVVGPKDKVEVLGDVIIGRTARSILGRLNGRKRLRMGNHDIFVKKNNADYAEHFEEITAYKVLPDLICSHIPLHPESVKERWKANVHGHLHTGRVMTYGTFNLHSPSGFGPTMEIKQVVDPIYLCVSMEHIDYTPISIDEVYQRINDQQEAAGREWGWVRTPPTKGEAM